MATIIRAAESPQSHHGVAMNLDDFAAQACQYLDDIKLEAAQLVEQARQEVESIRQQAEVEGRQAALRAVEDVVAERLAPALLALRQAAADLQQTRQAWLSHWESAAVHLSAAIAARVIRGELRRQPEITLTLVREALELAAGSPGVRLHLNPEDYRLLESQVRTLIDAMSTLSGAEVTPDISIGRGGCRVETSFGTIDQQFEAQLQRIEEELSG